VDAVFGEGEPNETVLTGADSGTSETFMARFATYGTLVWAKVIIVYYQEVGGSVDTLAGANDGGFFAVGHFDGTAVFGEGEANETVLEATYSPLSTDDLFIARYTENGDLIWARRDGADMGEEASASIVLPDGSLAITGTFKSSTTLGSGDLTEVLVEQYQFPTSYQQFVAQYDSDGTLKWAGAEGGKDTGVMLAADQTGGLLTAGNYLQDATFGLGQPNETTLDAPWERGGFVSALDQDGDLSWVAGAAVTDADQTAMFSSVSYLAADSYLVAGTFRHGLAFDDEDNPVTLDAAEEYDGELFIARFSADGHLDWARSTASADGRFGRMEYGPRVEPLQDGGFLLNGALWGTALIGVDDSDGLGEECWLDTVCDGDPWQVDKEPFVALCDNSGNVKWCARVAQNWEDVRSAHSTVLDDGTFMLAGHFTGDVDLLVNDEAVTVSSQMESLIPRSDGFLMRVCPILE
jgi:hypothetical protein